MHEKRRHYRVALKEIRETPENGVYVTNAEIKRCGLLAGAAFLILTFLAVFHRKG